MHVQYFSSKHFAAAYDGPICMASSEREALHAAWCGTQLILWCGALLLQQAHAPLCCSLVWQQSQQALQPLLLVRPPHGGAVCKCPFEGFEFILLQY